MYSLVVLLCLLRAFNRFLQRKYRNMLVNLWPWCLLVSICMYETSITCVAYACMGLKSIKLLSSACKRDNYIYFYSPGCACLSHIIHACMCYADMHTCVCTNMVCLYCRKTALFHIGDTVIIPIDIGVFRVTSFSFIHQLHVICHHHSS